MLGAFLRLEGRKKKKGEMRGDLRNFREWGRTRPSFWVPDVASPAENTGLVEPPDEGLVNESGPLKVQDVVVLLAEQDDARDLLLADGFAEKVLVGARLKVGQVLFPVSPHDLGVIGERKVCYCGGNGAVGDTPQPHGACLVLEFAEPGLAAARSAVTAAGGGGGGGSG